MPLKPTEELRLQALHLMEQDYWKNGAITIAGIDEVGRGPLAGPVVAACVVIKGPLMLEGLNDSKKVTARRRERLDEEIRACAFAIGIGQAEVAEIEATSIAEATRTAMLRSLGACGVVPDMLLIDAMRLAEYAGRQRAVIDGDALSAAIAAASIVAKVYRDELLAQLDGEFPMYGFAAHKGYGTAAHMAALRLHGPSVHHRKTFAPVRALLPA